MSNMTTAEWQGDKLVIHWFGIPAHPNDTGAEWTGTHLFFEGIQESKQWALPEKPTAEEALDLILVWQSQGY